MSSHPPIRIERHIFLLAAVWTLLFAASFAWQALRDKENMLTLARNQAKNVYEKDVLYRRWAAQHGGVYAPVTEKTQPNPYLSNIEERDITTPSGRKLTLINPAYMTRQVFELAAEHYNIQGHLTSLNPLRPQNAPDKWEAEALRSFEEGRSEASSLETISGKQYFRLMYPMLIEEPCLKCHAAQGYLLGQIRGGISVSVPMASYDVLFKKRLAALAEVHGLFWSLGVAGLLIGGVRVRNKMGERDQALGALAESEARFKILFQQAPLSYQSLNAEAAVIDVNETWESLTGYSRTEAKGKPFHGYLAEKDRQAFLHDFEKLKTEGRINGAEYILNLRDGAHRTIALSAKTSTGKDGRFQQAHCIFHDITEQKLVEEEKRRMEQQLRTSQKMEAVGTLAGGVAHDFNNILMVIMGFTELSLQTMSLDDRNRENLNRIAAAAERARDIVLQILAFSPMKVNESFSLNMGLLVRETMKLVRASTPSTIEIVEEIDPVAGDIMADPSQLKQVLLNLTTNAAQAMRETGGSIFVKVERITLNSAEAERSLHLAEGDYVKLSIRDTGPGMDKKILARAFEPYFTTKDVGEGSGLGLAVVHGIVNGHGGAVEVDCRPEGGCEFLVYFPKLPSGKAFSGDFVGDFGPVKGTERILFVDDEPLLRQFGEKTLSDMGYNVTSAASGKEALEKFKKSPEQFDVVITDQTMFGMTGAELAGELLALKPDLPVVVCTGHSEILNEDKAREIGAKEFLMKPLSGKRLAQAIRRVLG